MATRLLEDSVVGQPDDEIVALESRLRDSQLAADVGALDQLIAEDLLFVGPDGQLATKSQDLAAHASGVVRFREHVPEELRIRRIGPDVAVAALRARLAVEVHGALASGTYRYTRVWARERGGDWRVVGGHVSAVAPTAMDTSTLPQARTPLPAGYRQGFITAATVLLGFTLAFLRFWGFEAEGSWSYRSFIAAIGLMLALLLQVIALIRSLRLADDDVAEYRMTFRLFVASVVVLVANLIIAGVIYSGVL
jgi:ketosteroid isomerase-like protein